MPQMAARIPNAPAPDDSVRLSTRSCRPGGRARRRALAHRQVPLAPRRTDQHQVRHVGARSHQDEANRSEQNPRAVRNTPTACSRRLTTSTPHLALNSGRAVRSPAATRSMSARARSSGTSARNRATVERNRPVRCIVSRSMPNGTQRSARVFGSGRRRHDRPLPRACCHGQFSSHHVRIAAPPPLPQLVTDDDDVVVARGVFFGTERAAQNGRTPSTSKNGLTTTPRLRSCSGSPSPIRLTGTWHEGGHLLNDWFWSRQAMKLIGLLRQQEIRGLLVGRDSPSRSTVPKA